MRNFTKFAAQFSQHTFHDMKRLITIILFAGIRERMEYSDIPKSMQGFPIALISAGIMSIAFMGFQGLVN